MRWLPTVSPKLVYSEALEAYGGYRREEAIMLLRRFYMTENIHGESSTHTSCEGLPGSAESAPDSLYPPAPAPRDKSKRGNCATPYTYDYFFFVTYTLDCFFLQS